MLKGLFQQNISQFDFRLFGWDNSNFQVQSKRPSTILFSSTPQDGKEQELGGLLAKLEVADQHDRQESEEHNLADR